MMLKLDLLYGLWVWAVKKVHEHEMSKQDRDVEVILCEITNMRINQN